MELQKEGFNANAHHSKVKNKRKKAKAGLKESWQQVNEG